MNPVRPYRERDKLKVQQICLENADCETASDDTRKYILIMYCNYYLEQEPQNCFVAVDENDEPIGYIICAQNYETYARVFTEQYLPQAAAISARRYVDAKLDMLSHAMFRSQYPAHLHIDITASYQHKGYGTRLVNALKQHLAAKNIDGVMLVCGADNVPAINFYTKNGFKDLLTTKFGKAMALDFEPKL